MNKNLQKISVGVAVLFLLAAWLGMPAFAQDASETPDERDQNLKIYVDGVLFVPTDDSQNTVEPLIHEGTVYLPVEVFGKAFGKSVEWDRGTNSVYIGKPTEQEILEITVGTAEELIAALGSDRIIYLNEGVYNLTAADPGYTSPAVYFGEQHDGPELFLEDVHNLTIQGIGDKQSQIVVEPRYANVMNFRDCSNISIVNIEAGHTNGGECSGGVFLYTNCENIQIRDTLMYGCGTKGLIMNRTNNVTVANSSIYECTNGIMNIDFGSNISFQNCVFRDNATKESMVYAEQTSNLSMDSCTFLRNTYAAAMFDLVRSQNVTVTSSDFIDNKALVFVERGEIPFDDTNRFLDNAFTVTR